MIGYSPAQRPFEEGRLTKISLSYFFQLGFHINALALIRPEMNAEELGMVVFPALHSLREIVADEERLKEVVPRVLDSAKTLLPTVEKLASGALMKNQLEPLRNLVASVSVTISEDLDRVFAYRLYDKGNLSVSRLVNGAADGYSKDVKDCLDVRVIVEIDEAGVCLACSLYTACGFHILRSVEICIKAYVHASTGKLPAVSQRNWGEYIRVLQATAGTNNDLIDLLRILKAKRNPLMHPQDSLEEGEAIDIFCICQSVTREITKEVKSQSMEQKFLASLALLPTL